MIKLYKQSLLNDSKPHLVMLHGWASSSDIWRSSLVWLRPHFSIHLIDLPGFGRSEPSTCSENELIDAVARALPQPCVLLGWSLGGMIAEAIAARFPDQVTHLITIGSNQIFVPDAMDTETFSAFKQGMETSAERQLKRFNALQIQGDDHARRLRRELPNCDASQKALLQGLDWLGAIDNRKAHISCPTAHFIGASDALASSRAESNVIEGCGHLPFLSQPETLWPRVIEFAATTVAPNEKIDKAAVASSFSHAASSYDAAAHLQREIANGLLAKLPNIELGTVLNLGCGTGYEVATLSQAYPNSQLINLDLAEGMASTCATKYPRARAVCADAESLPLHDNSVDLIYSSLSIQWCENLPALFGELARVLTPGGSAHIATLGPKTLNEMRQAWQSVDGYEHVNEFVPLADLEAALALTDLSLKEHSENIIVKHYQRLVDLMRELKQLGAHNHQRARPNGLTGRQRLAALIEDYERFRRPEGLPASWQVWTLQLEKPES